METPVNCHSELMEDPLRNIEPVQFGVKQMCQASVELSSITDDTGCGIQQTLWPVSDGSWRPGQHGIATVNARCNEGMCTRKTFNVQRKCQGPLQLLSPLFLMTSTTKQERGGVDDILF